MKKSLILLLGVALLALAACQPAAQTPAATVATQSSQPVAPQSGYPAATAGAPAGAYPAQATSGAATDGTSAYPAPQNAAGPGSLYPPTDADSAMTRGDFTLASASLQPRADAPGQADLIAAGSLPTACSQIRVRLNPPDAQNKIVVEVYSVVEKDKSCAQTLQPFDGKLALLGGYPSGKYTVVVNDKPAGELTVP